METLNPVFGTHVPVLKALDPPPTRVLEYGSGYFSTATFLAMPSVVQLVSVELYPDWADQMAEEFGGEHYERWTLLDANDEVPPLLDFDLVFVDDGRTEDERIGTIAHVLGQPHPRVVIHDAEFHRFLAAIQQHAGGCGWVVHAEQMPHTAVVEASA